MTVIFAIAREYGSFLIVLLVVLGIPSVVWGALMTLSGLFEQRQAVRDEGQMAPAKLQIGVLLLILGIASLAVLVGIAYVSS